MTVTRYETRDDDEPAAQPRKDSTMLDPELQAACTKHGIRVDAEDERTAALALLDKLGLPGSHETTSGGRLDSKSDAYIVARAVAKARGYADELKHRTATPKRVDRTDAEREDDERFDESAPHYDASGEICDLLDDSVVPVEPGALRFDGNGQLIGDYYRSDAVEDARQKMIDERTIELLVTQGVSPEQAKERVRLDHQADEVAERFGTKRRQDHMSTAQVDSERRKTDKARQDMRDDRERAYRGNETRGGLSAHVGSGDEPHGATAKSLGVTKFPTKASEIERKDRK